MIPARAALRGRQAPADSECGTRSSESMLQQGEKGLRTGLEADVDVRDR